MDTPSFSADFAMFGQDAAGFGPPVGTLKAIARAGEVGELDAFDLAYPFAESDLSLDAVAQELSANGLRASVVHSVLYSDQFRDGALTNPNPALRQEAVRIVTETAEAAKRLGADFVKIWPGRDGYDYPFQVDHRRLWDLAVDGLRAIGEAAPNVRFGIEYKRKEPRTHMVFSDTARVLLAIEEAGVSNVGVVIDLGHSLFANETPADAIQLAARRAKLIGVEFNDNFRASDDDLIVGSVHLVETLEFIHAVRESGWDGVWELDQTGTREDPVLAARASIRVLNALNRIATELDSDALAAAQRSSDAVEAQRIVHGALLGELAGRG